ncbi:MAG: hypothetical protein GX289_03280 [Tissierellia bacterium]|jgi:hypothetical protein|nr:hypothetical protein [Tissierellia bacterium]
MKKRFIFTMVLLFLFSYTSINGYEYHKEIDTIEYLLKERLEIMNEFLYGYKDMHKLKEKLSKIESDNLLQNDLDILYKVIDCPTDYELAMNVKVNKIYLIELTDDEYLINADLNWLMRGYDGEFNIIRNYDINCIKVNGQLYLTKLTILNDWE